MAISLPEVLLNNMDKWEYDEDGFIVATKAVSFEMSKAIDEMNELEKQAQSSDRIIHP